MCRQLQQHQQLNLDCDTVGTAFNKIDRYVCGLLVSSLGPSCELITSGLMSHMQCGWRMRGGGAVWVEDEGRGCIDTLTIIPASCYQTFQQLFMLISGNYTAATQTAVTHSRCTEVALPLLQ